MSKLIITATETLESPREKQKSLTKWPRFLWSRGEILIMGVVCKELARSTKLLANVGHFEN